MTEILVIGSGAIASYFSAKLAKTSSITMLCRSDYQVIKNHGIKIISPLGNLHFHPQVINDLTQYNHQCDYMIIATKALDSIDFIAMIKQLKYPPKNIVLIQNGIHIENKIYKNFPNINLISVLAFIAVSRIESGIVEHFAYGKLTLGNFPSGLNKECLELIEILKSCDVETQASTNIQEERWKKLIWNGAFNPVSVLSGGCDTKKLLENANCKDLLQKIMKEIIALACLDGYNLADDLIAKNIKATEEMKPYKTSMLLDFEAKRPMEIEAIIGNALNFAKTKSYPTPYLSTIYALLSCY